MRKQWIDGSWSRPKRESIPVIDPATEEVLDSVSRGTADDADRGGGGGAPGVRRLAFPAGCREGDALARGRAPHARAATPSSRA